MCLLVILLPRARLPSSSPVSRNMTVADRQQLFCFCYKPELFLFRLCYTFISVLFIPASAINLTHEIVVSVMLWRVHLSQ